MRCLILVLVGAGGFAGSASVQEPPPPKPAEAADLEIIDVHVLKGTTVKVLVGNRGGANAGPCRMLMEIWQPDKKALHLVDKVTVNVLAIDARTKIWVTINSPLALGPGRELRLEVNVTKAVREVDYDNNRYRWVPKGFPPKDGK